MKRTLIALVFATLAAFAANAEEKTKTYEFKNITGIEAGYTYDIHVTQGKSDVVTVVYESTYEDYMTVHFSERTGVLRLGMEEIPKRLIKEKGQSIKVYLDMKQVLGIDLSGAASITFEGSFNTSELEIELSGASKLNDLNVKGISLSGDFSGASYAYIEGTFTDDVDLEVSGASKVTFNGKSSMMEGDFSGAARFEGDIYADKCDIECSGAANARMEGAAKTMEIDGSGACSINAKDFVADKVNISLSGACNAKVHATKILMHDISRTCKMTYYGDAELQNMGEDPNIVKGR